MNAPQPRPLLFMLLGFLMGAITMALWMGR